MIVQATPAPASACAEPDRDTEVAARADAYATLSRLWGAAPSAAHLRCLCASGPQWREDGALQSAWAALLFEARALQAQDIAQEYRALFGTSASPQLRPLRDAQERLVPACEGMCHLVAQGRSLQVQRDRLVDLQTLASCLCVAAQANTRARFYAALAAVSKAFFLAEARALGAQHVH